jgi:hypothetical protein
VAYLRIRANAARGQRVKNRHSVRDVPLHRQLLADGLVAWARSRPGERLFSYLSAVASKRLLRRFAAMGLGARARSCTASATPSRPPPAG